MSFADEYSSGSEDEEFMALMSTATSTNWESPPKTMMSRIGRRQKTRANDQKLRFLHDLREAFNAADEGRTGRLTHEQWCSSDLINVVHDGQMSDEDFANYFKRIDANCDGYIEWSEFVSYLMKDISAVDLKSKDVAAQFIRKMIYPAPGKLQCHREMIQQVAVCDKIGEYITISSDSIRFWKASDMSFRRAFLEPGLFAKMLVFEQYLVLAVTTMNRKLILFDLDTFTQLPAQISASPSASQIKKMTKRDALSALKVIRSPKMPLFNVPSVMALGDITAREETYSFFFIGDDQGVIEVFKLIDPTRRRGIDYRIERTMRHTTHTDTITQISTIAGLDCYASSSSDHTVKFWTFHEKPTPSFSVLRVFTDTVPIIGFNFSNAQKVLTSCCASRDCYVWNISPPRKIFKMEQHYNQIQNVADFITTTKERYIVTMTNRKEFRLWDAVNYRMIREWTDASVLRPENRYGAMVFDQRRHALITASSYPVKWAEDVSALNESLEPVTHGHPIVGCQYATEFNQLVTVDTISGIRVWNINTGTLASNHTELWTSESSDISTATLDATGRRLITYNFKNCARLWNYNSGTVICPLDLKPESPLVTIVKMVTINNRVFLLRAGWDRTICLYTETERAQFELSRKFVAHTNDISAVAVHQAGVVSGSVNGEVFCWSLDTNIPISEAKIAGKTGIECIACFDEYCFVCDSNGFLHTFSLPKLTELNCTSAHGIVSAHSLSAIVIDEVRGFMYTADTYGYVKKWQIEQCEDGSISLNGILIERCHLDEVTHLTLILDGKYIATTGVDMCVRLWECTEMRYIGMFTEMSKWDITDPSTYDTRRRIIQKDPKHFTKTSNLMKSSTPSTDFLVKDVSTMKREETQEAHANVAVSLPVDSTPDPVKEFDIERVRKLIDDYTDEHEARKMRPEPDFRSLLETKEPVREVPRAPRTLATSKRPQDLLENISDMIRTEGTMEKAPQSKPVLKIPVIPIRHGRKSKKPQMSLYFD